MQSEDILEMIKQTRLFSFLSEEELRFICPFLKSIHLPPGEKFIIQSKPITGAYFIVSGEILLYSKQPGETFISLHRSMPKDCIGLCGLDKDCLSFYTAMTKAPSVVLKLPIELMVLLAQTQPALCHKIHRALTKEFLLHQHANIQDIHHALDSELGANIPKAMRQACFQTPFGQHSTQPFSWSLQREMKKSKHTLHRWQETLIKRFSAQDISVMENHSELVDVAPNARLFEKNALKNCWFLILEGCVEVNLDLDGKIAKICLLGPKTMFGEIAEHELHHRREIYRPREITSMLKFTPLHLATLEKAHPELYYDLYAMMTHQIMTLVSQTRQLFEPILQFQRHSEKETL